MPIHPRKIHLATEDLLQIPNKEISGLSETAETAKSEIRRFRCRGQFCYYRRTNVHAGKENALQME